MPVTTATQTRRYISRSNPLTEMYLVYSCRAPIHDDKHVKIYRLSSDAWPHVNADKEVILVNALCFFFFLFFFLQ